MPGLLDVAKSTKTVAVGEVLIPIYGISAHGIALLFERFPIIREIFAGKGEEISVERIVTLVPDAIALIIACGTGYSKTSPEELAAAEKAAAELGASDQLEILEAILQATMKRGYGPFVEKLKVLAGTLGVTESGESMSTPATT